MLTAGENSPRVVDHFPVTRASRWKQGQVPPSGGGAYEVMQTDDGMDPPGQPMNRGANQMYPISAAHDDMGV